MAAGSMQYPEGLIFLFAREPQAGRVKTRLVPVLGEEGALDLYQQLLARQIGVLEISGLCPAELWVDGDPQAAAFAGFSGLRHRQQGGGLGERMRFAAAQGLGRNAFVILIGSDCPGLDAGYLAQAARALASGEELVIGPAEDGGYVLLGLRRCEPALFEDIEWGGERVLAQTLEKARKAGMEPVLLPPLADIDRPADLPWLAPFGIFPRISRPLLAEGKG